MRSLDTPPDITVFDQQRLLTSVGDQLTAIDSLLRWASLVAVGFWWAAVQNADPMAVIGLKTSRTGAAYVAACFFVLVGIIVAVRIQQIGDIIEMAPNGIVIKVISCIALHASLTNPFTLLGMRTSRRIYSGLGFALLNAVFWFCMTSTIVLGGTLPQWTSVALIACYMLILAMWLRVSYRVFALAVTRVRVLYGDKLGNAMYQTASYRMMIGLVSSAVGFGMACLTISV